MWGRPTVIFCGFYVKQIINHILFQFLFLLSSFLPLFNLSPTLLFNVFQSIRDCFILNNCLIWINVGGLIIELIRQVERFLFKQIQFNHRLVLIEEDLITFHQFSLSCLSRRLTLYSTLNIWRWGNCITSFVSLRDRGKATLIGQWCHSFVSSSFR